MRTLLKVIGYAIVGAMIIGAGTLWLGFIVLAAIGKLALCCTGKGRSEASAERKAPPTWVIRSK